MAKYIHESRIWDYTPGSDTAAGTVVVLGSNIGVTNIDIKANKLGAIAVRGSFEFPTDGATPFAVGDQVQWNGTQMIAATAGAVHGVVSKAAAASDTVVRVDISPSYAYTA